MVFQRCTPLSFKQLTVFARTHILEVCLQLSRVLQNQHSVINDKRSVSFLKLFYSYNFGLAHKSSLLVNDIKVR